MKTQKNLDLFNSILNDNYETFINKMFNSREIINIHNKKGESLLHFCCFHGIIDKYYALVNFHVIPTLTKKQNSLLHYACFGGKDDFLIVELVKSGIKPDSVNLNNETCLHLSSNEKIAHYLNLWCMRHNINIENLLTKNGNTVAHSCFSYGFFESANYWIRHYPNLALIKNNKMMLWNESSLKHVNYCQLN
jgi:hypothetical protein